MSAVAPHIFSECDYSPGIYPVGSIDWCDPNIYRAGVTPIYYDGKNKWIGLGISRYNGSIVSIGGTLELYDHDLLSTAVREYNEEVGPNMPNITEEVVYGCYAIRTETSINILLPVASIPPVFQPTNEIHSIIWVTPKQLSIMSERQNFILYGSSGTKHKKSVTRAFSFGTGLSTLAPILCQAVDLMIGFYTAADPYPFERPMIRQMLSYPQMISDFDTFKTETLSNRSLYVVAYVRSNNYVGIMRQDKNFYFLPIDQEMEILKILEQAGIVIFTSINMNLSVYGHGNPRLVKSICDKLYGIENMQLEYMNALHNATLYEPNETVRLYNEAALIIEYESKIYKISSERGLCFDQSRANLLVGISIINQIITAHDSIIYSRLVKLLKTYPEVPRTSPTVYTTINIMINVGLLTQHPDGQLTIQ